MMGKTHRPFGALLGAAYAIGAAAGPYTLVYAAIGYVCATLPDRIEGVPGLHRHRGLSHAWEFPAAALAVSLFLPRDWSVLVSAVAVSLISHLVGDWLFGLSSPYRGAGIPMRMGRRHRGLDRFRAGGRVELVVRPIVSVCAVLATLVGIALPMGL
jgi:hypothetical protein